MKPSLFLLCLLCGCEMRVKFKDAPAPPANGLIVATNLRPAHELKTTWHMCFTNGVDGPVSVVELSADKSRILRELPVLHKK